jgi:hypothetical protein
MDATNASAEEPLVPTADATKAISELDDLVQAVLKLVPDSKPWQRQLQVHLRDADRGLQVLRMTIALRREVREVAEAASSVHRVLGAANGYVAATRADINTKAAVRLAFELGLRIERLLGF